MRIPQLTRCFISVALCTVATGCFPYHATIRMGVSGTVVDAETHAPLAGARVSFDRHDPAEPFITTSAADGSFNLPKQKQWQIRFIVGDYFLDRLIGGTVSIHHDGYEPKTTDVTPFDGTHHYHTQMTLGIVQLTPSPETH